MRSRKKKDHALRARSLQGPNQYHPDHICLSVCQPKKTNHDLTISNSHLFFSHMTHHTPSSIPTLRHHGLSPSLFACSANMFAASPTCLRSLISMLTWPLSFNFIALLARKGLYMREPFLPCAIPRDDRMSSLDVHPSLMTGNCYCRGSDDDESRLRWRYTSVP